MYYSDDLGCSFDGEYDDAFDYRFEPVAECSICDEPTEIVYHCGVCDEPLCPCCTCASDKYANVCPECEGAFVWIA